MNGHNLTKNAVTSRVSSFCNYKPKHKKDKAMWRFYIIEKGDSGPLTHPAQTLSTSWMQTGNARTSRPNRQTAAKVALPFAAGTTQL